MDDIELRETIARLQAELERRNFEQRRPGPRVEVAPRTPVPPASPVPPPPPLIEERSRAPLGWKPCPVCRTPRPLKGACPGCCYEPVQKTAPAAPAPAPQPGVLDTLGGWSERLVAAVREQGFERFLGERLFSYIGMVLVVLGGAFFLKYAAEHSGPWGRVAVGALAGFGGVGLGEFLRRRPGLKASSIPVTAGAWALVCYTAYAAHAVDASRVVSDPALALLLLGGAVGLMIAHSAAVGSRALTAFALAVSYFAFAATDFGPQTLGVCTVLGLAGAWLARRLKAPELVPIGLVGYAVNYWPTLEAAFKPGRTAEPGRVALELGAAAAVYGAAVLAAPAADDDPRASSWTDSSLAFGAVLLGAAAHAQGASLGAWPGAAAGLAVAGLFALLAARGGERAEAARSVQTFLASVLAAVSIWRLPTPEAQLWGFAMASAALGAAGRAMGRDGFDRGGLGLAVLGGLTVLSRLGSLAGSEWGAAALFAFCAAAYGLGLSRNGDSGDAWLNAGALAMLGALWLALPQAPFVVASLVFALVLRGAWDLTQDPRLFQQAIAFELFSGVCYLGMDFGSAAPIWGPLTERAATGLALTGGYAALLASPAAPEGAMMGVSLRRWRANVSWLALAVAARASFGAFDPALRLPMSVAASMALLRLGRGRGELAKDQRAQAYLVAALAPSQAASSLVGAGLASALLLLPLLWERWGKTEEERKEEVYASFALAGLSVGLLAQFAAREAAGSSLTLWWTAVGGSYLAAGLMAGRKELRWPALALLGLCVAKALMLDLTGLPLPTRMLTMTVLGLILVACSLAYVRLVREEPPLLVLDGRES